MKNVIFLLAMIQISIVAFGQFDLTLSASGGLSKLQGQNFQTEGIESNHCFTSGVDMLVQLNKSKHIQPFAGCSFYVLQSKLDYPTDWHLLEPTNRFRFNFLRIPIGVDAPVFKTVGIRLALINGFLVGGTETSPEAAKYEFGVQPGIFYSLDQWKIGCNYYRGFTDVFHRAEAPQNTAYWKVYNSAFYLTISYKLPLF